MNALAGSVRPAIAHGMLLQWEPAQDAHVLLYPEGMVKLNGTAARSSRAATARAPWMTSSPTSSAPTGRAR